MALRTLIQTGAVVSLASAVTVWAVEAPVVVSPGDASKLVLIEDACPTFSWTDTAGAERYELVVYAVGESEGESRRLLSQRLPGGATSWTPSLDACPERGGKYAWSLRAVVGGKATEWSAPRLFQVLAGPTEAELESALGVVQRSLSTGGARAMEPAPTLGSEDSEDLEDPEPNGNEASPGTSAAPAATLLAVAGNIAATSFTGDGENLTNVATDAELAAHASATSAHHSPTPQVWSKSGSTAYYTSSVRVGSSTIGSARLNAVETFATYRTNGDRMFRATRSTAGAGYISTQGPNGLENARFTSHSSSPNHGFISVRDASGSDQAGLYVNSNGKGIVFGDTKSFRVQHPNDPTQEIWYASIEGPEAAAYERGTAQLEGGRAQVEFSGHFAALINPSTLTVMVTPLSAESVGLAVVEKTGGGFEVRELHDGSGSYAFDWEVKAVRKGHEGFEALRPRGYLERLAVQAAEE